MPVRGVYLISAHLAWDANSGHDRKIQIHVVGGGGVDPDNAAAEGPPVQDAGKWTQQSVSDTLDLAAGNVVQLQAYQNSGGPLDIKSADRTMAWLGPG